MLSMFSEYAINIQQYCYIFHFNDGLMNDLLSCLHFLVLGSVASYNLNLKEYLVIVSVVVLHVPYEVGQDT